MLPLWGQKPSKRVFDDQFIQLFKWINTPKHNWQAKRGVLLKIKSEKYIDTMCKQISMTKADTKRDKLIPCGSQYIFRANIKLMFNQQNKNYFYSRLVSEENNNEKKFSRLWDVAVGSNDAERLSGLSFGQKCCHFAVKK